MTTTNRTEAEEKAHRTKIEQFRQEVNSKVRSMFLFSDYFDSMHTNLSFSTFKFSASVGIAEDIKYPTVMKVKVSFHTGGYGGSGIEASLTWSKEEKGWYLKLADMLFKGFMTLMDLGETTYVKDLPEP